MNTQRPATIREIAAAAILLLAMLASAGIALSARRAAAPDDVAHPDTANEWLVRAELRAQAGDLSGAEQACRAALAHTPWHPGAVHRLSVLLLERGDADALRLWMDDLVLGDARLAEQVFMRPGFAAFLDRPDFRALYQEAKIQARD